MDTFMDKLASKLNAQEMIRANSAAEAAESERLKQEVEVYRQCLQEMREIGLQNASTADEVAELVKTSMDKIAAIQAESGKSDDVLMAMKSNSESMLNEMKNNSESMLNEVKSSSNSMLNEIKSSTSAMVNAVQNTMQTNSDTLLVEVQARNDDLKESIKAELLADIKKELKAQDENVHKECVKVYRNVQAVVTEENERQAENIMENQTKIKKRATAALVCGILAMSFAALQLVISILEITGVFNLIF